MLRTSAAAVVLGCFYFCPLDCDASVMVVDFAAVDTGCMLEKYMLATGCNKVRVHLYFLVEVLLLLLLRAAAAAHNISCLLYTSPSPRDQRGSRMPSSA